MNLSFSTNGWYGYSFEDFCDAAEYLGFKGIELHNIYNRIFSGEKGAFNDYEIATTRRTLFEKKIKIPCMDSVSDISDTENGEKTLSEINKCLALAEKMHIPYLRVRAKAEENNEKYFTFVTGILEQVIPAAESKNVVVLIETSGMFADTSVLRNILENFASDSLAALWNVSAAFQTVGEKPETVIKNLGAYVKHVHLTDTKKTESGVEHCLIGEGELPIKDIMLALRSVNFDGFISLVWDPRWLEEIDDMEVIFSHFVNFMKQFNYTSGKEKTLYYNNAHTGRFVWKKDLLIEKTFSDVLDRMVEEFPDQYAFKYTTLDYTRTYSEFRDDVDEFARVLISMGVKAGSHVAVWASNVPQWFITFWATVKLGAVLVTVNTAYKIHELEYLLKQSDTHTLVITEGAKDTHYGKIVAELCPELENTAPGSPLHAKRLPFLRNVITVGFKQKGCLEWNEALERASKVNKEEVYAMAAAVKPDDVCNISTPRAQHDFPRA